METLKNFIFRELLCVKRQLVAHYPKLNILIVRIVDGGVINAVVDVFYLKRDESSFIDLFSMPYTYDKNNEGLVFKPTNEAVISYPVTP